MSPRSVFACAVQQPVEKSEDRRLPRVVGSHEDGQVVAQVKRRTAETPEILDLEPHEERAPDWSQNTPCFRSADRLDVDHRLTLVRVPTSERSPNRVRKLDVPAPDRDGLLVDGWVQCARAGRWTMRRLSRSSLGQSAYRPWWSRGGPACWR